MLIRLARGLITWESFTPVGLMAPPSGGLIFGPADELGGDAGAHGSVVINLDPRGDNACQHKTPKLVRDMEKRRFGPSVSKLKSENTPY